MVSICCFSCFSRDIIRSRRRSRERRWSAAAAKLTRSVIGATSAATATTYTSTWTLMNIQAPLWVWHQRREQAASGNEPPKKYHKPKVKIPLSCGRRVAPPTSHHDTFHHLGESPTTTTTEKEESKAAHQLAARQSHSSKRLVSLRGNQTLLLCCYRIVIVITMLLMYEMVCARRKLKCIR